MASNEAAPERSDLQLSSWGRIAQYIPIINFFYDMLWLGEPGKEEITKLTEVMGIMSALLLGCVGGIQTAVGHGDLVEASNRLANCWYLDSGDNAADDFLRICLTTTVFLFFSVTLSVQIYCSLISANLSEDIGDANEALKKYTMWYDSIRGLLCVAIIMTLAGIILFVGTVFRLYVVQTPIPDAEVLGCTVYTESKIYQTFWIWITVTLCFGVGPFFWLAKTHYKMIRFDTGKSSKRSQGKSAEGKSAEGKLAEQVAGA